MELRNTEVRLSGPYQEMLVCDQCLEDSTVCLLAPNGRSEP